MSFIDFARIHGVDIDPSRLYASDKIKRCGTIDKPRSTNGAYFWDGERGWVYNWAGESRVEWYQDPNAKPWTDEDKRAWAAKRQSAAQEQEKRYQQAAQKADIMLRAAERKTHDYLHLKGFPDELALVLEGRLMIPMRDVVTNALRGYQAIHWLHEERKFEKKMMSGMRAKGAVFWMGPRNAPEIWFVEGYATGLSLHAALKSMGIAAAVVVTFSASNMVHCAGLVKGTRYVFADNDASQTGQKSAEQTGLPWTMADTVGWDCNDLHKHKGLFAVGKKIMELRNAQQTL